MNQHPNRIVNLYHQGVLVSSQPWVWDDEVLDYFPSDELYCFYPEWNSAITPDTADVWDELHSYLISEVQNQLFCNKTTGDASVASISYEAAITFTIN